MTHPTYPRPADPLTLKNNFRERGYRPQEIITFAHARTLLPVPVIESRPEWVEMYWRAWELAWNNLRRPRPASGLIANFIDTPYNDHTFMWDSAFMVQFGLYGRRGFNFMGTLDNFYGRQHDDGFICREINTHEGYDFFYPFDPNSSGPNILAWAEWRYFRQTGDNSRLAEVFWPLLAFHRWFRAARTWPSGLYWATGLSSGMDTQNRVPDSKHYHHHWTWVDTNMQAALNCWVLSQMATVLEEKEHTEELNRERAFLVTAINRALWNQESNFYQDVDPAGQFSPVKSIGAYWGLLDKELVPADHLEPFLRHLREGATFKRPHRIPAQAADSPGYDPEGGYWQGGVWPATNYMVLKGLRVVGQHTLAHQIALNHLENIYQVYQRTDTFWENYAPEMAMPGSGAKANFVGWSGLSPIAILLEDVIGLTVDWPLRRVMWDKRLELPGRYGVTNYPLGQNGILDLTCQGNLIEITTTVPFTLTIQDETGTLQAAIPVGDTELTL